MILHIPHSSKEIPGNLRDQIVLSDDELTAELILMTDAYTDELFTFTKATSVKFPLSRLLVDVERFPDDAEEPMSRVGMGMIYTRTATGKKLKQCLQPDERAHLRSLYKAHHEALLHETECELTSPGTALIIDCHSFPSHPLPCDRDQSVNRPDFCIGTDSFHTPRALAQMIVENLKQIGYTVQMNCPYDGTLVPLKYYKKDPRVTSVMIEVNRRLYMDVTTGLKTSAFDSIRKQIHGFLISILAFEKDSHQSQHA